MRLREIEEACVGTEARTLMAWLYAEFTKPRGRRGEGMALENGEEGAEVAGMRSGLLAISLWGGLVLAWWPEEQVEEW